MPKRGTILGVLLLHAVLLAAALGIRTCLFEELPIGLRPVFWLIPQTQSVLLAAWAVLGKTRACFRWPLAALGIVLLGVLGEGGISARALNGSKGFHAREWPIVILICILPSLFVGMVFKRQARRSSFDQLADSKALRPPLQFSLAQLFLFTTLIATALTVYRQRSEKCLVSPYLDITEDIMEIVYIDGESHLPPPSWLRPPSDAATAFRVREWRYDPDDSTGLSGPTGKMSQQYCWLLKWTQGSNFERAEARQHYQGPFYDSLFSNIGPHPIAELPILFQHWQVLVVGMRSVLPGAILMVLFKLILRGRPETLLWIIVLTGFSALTLAAPYFLMYPVMEPTVTGWCRYLSALDAGLPGYFWVPIFATYFVMFVGTTLLLRRAGYRIVARPPLPCPVQESAKSADEAK